MLRILKISLLVSVVVLLNAMTTLLFVQNAVPASAGPQCVDGDVNGDAAVDITDPIYLLSYMFGGGPAPVACAQNPGAITAVEMETVLNKFFPKPGDYLDFNFELEPNMQGIAQEVFVVPDDKFLMVTDWCIDTNNGQCWRYEVVSNSNPIPPGTEFLPCNGSSFSNLEKWLYPGDVLLVTGTCGAGWWGRVVFKGYFLNAD